MMSFGLIVNMTSLVCCFMFFVFLFVLYFSKKNVDNIENKIYRRMLFCNGGYIIFLLIFTLLIKDSNFCSLINFFICGSLKLL